MKIDHHMALSTRCFSSYILNLKSSFPPLYAIILQTKVDVRLIGT